MLYANEMLLVQALADMEYRGQLIDRDYLERLALELDLELASGDRQLSQLFGVRIEWHNDNTLRDLLYEQMKLPILSTTAKGLPSVDRAAIMDLGRLPGNQERMAALLDWRARNKVRTTYTTNLTEKLDDNCRLHCEFVPWGTVTGRLSSRNPNLQNIPSRHKELARRVRRAFIVDPGQARVYCDYSQIELRLLGWCTGCQALVNAYRSPSYDDLCRGVVGYDSYRSRRNSEPSVDAHGDIACATFGVNPTDPDFKSKRSAAKIINFGVPYGGGPNLLIHDPNLRLPEAQAKRFFADYHRQNPEINRTKARLLQSMRQSEDLTFVNWAGRTRHGHRLVWADSDIVKEEERSMFASLVQGSAGELTRFSIVRIWLAQRAGRIPGDLTSTVHDEIQSDCDVEDVRESAYAIQREMEGYTGLFGTTPIVADIEVTKTNWSAKEDYP